MKLKMIYSTDPNGVIGVFNEGVFKQPFHSRKDFDWFRKNTLDSCIIMGANTHKAIGKILPKRLNIVVSTTYQFDKPFTEEVLDLTVVKSIKEALRVANSHGYREVYFIGGANLFEQVYSLVDEVLVTFYNEYAPENDNNITFCPMQRDDLRLFSVEWFNDTDYKTGKSLSGEFMHFKSIYSGEYF